MPRNNTGTVCAVATCTMNFKRSKREGLKVSFFSFPKDKGLSNAWLEKCKRADRVNVKYARVCSLHFKASDFERDLKSELLNLEPRLILKRNSIPTVSLPSVIYVKKHRNQAREEMLLESMFKDIDNQRNDCLINDKKNCSGIPCGKEKVVFSSFTKCEDGNIMIALKKDNEDLKDMIARKQILLEKYASRVKILTVRCRKKCIQTRRKAKGIVKKEINRTLNHIFTKKQIQKIYTKGPAHWNKDDVIIVTTIQYLSKQCYASLRDYLCCSLPGISILPSWAGKYNRRRSLLRSKLEG